MKKFKPLSTCICLYSRKENGSSSYEGKVHYKTNAEDVDGVYLGNARLREYKSKHTDKILSFSFPLDF